MSITDELRKYASVSWNPWPEARDRLLQMCNRIDAEHERKVAEMTSSWDYWEYTHVELPKDADGEPIRFKDKVTVPWSEKVYEVSGFSYQENVHLGTMTIWINVHENGEYKALCAADSCHHHKPTTVEDVLNEMCDALNEVRMPLGSGMLSEEIIAKYAARLQLKEHE